MKRDITKSIEAYKKKYFHAGHGEGAFYVEDVDGICQYVNEKYGDELNRNTLFSMIGCALEAGFMIGYRKAQADARKGR